MVSMLVTVIASTEGSTLNCIGAIHMPLKNWSASRLRRSALRGLGERRASHQPTCGTRKQCNAGPIQTHSGAPFWYSTAAPIKNPSAIPTVRA